MRVTARTGVILLAMFGVLLAVGGVVASGGGAPNFAFDPPGDFRASAGSLCLDEAKETARTQMQLGQARSPARAARDERAIASSTSSFDDDFAALQPPVSLSAPYTDYLGSRIEVDGLMDRYAGTLEKGGSAATVDVRAQLDAARRRQWDAASALGLQGCSGQLDAATQKQVASVVERIDTSSDPAKVCRGMVFKSYVKSAFGGYADCRRFQKKASNTARSIDVERVSGVDGVSATVDFRDVAGPFDGRPLRASLFHSKNRWLLWNVVELSG